MCPLLRHPVDNCFHTQSQHFQCLLYSHARSIAAGLPWHVFIHPSCSSWNILWCLFSLCSRAASAHLFFGLLSVLRPAGLCVQYCHFLHFLCLQQKKEALVAFIYASHHCPYSFHFLLTVRNISLAFTFLRPHFYHHIKCGLCPLNSFLFILVDEPKILGAITFSSSFTQNRRLSIVNTCLFSILV